MAIQPKGRPHHVDLLRGGRMRVKPWRGLSIYDQASVDSHLSEVSFMKEDRPKSRVLSSIFDRNGRFGSAISRRGFLKTTASLATFAALPSALEDGQGEHARRPHDAPVKVNLRVRLARNAIPGIAPVRRPDDGLTRDVYTRTYNGSIPGPTLRVRPGDTLQLRLFNQLFGLEDIPMVDENIPHGFNVTNVHLHGLHVSPRDNSDNVFIAIPPGEPFDYEYHIPENHPDGTYWFHPHRHGSVAFQFMGGMAGALIIEGTTDAFLRDYFGAITDSIFVLQQIRVNNNPALGPVGEVPYIKNFLDLRLAPILTVNGQVNPTIRMRPGEVQRWRFIHAGMTDHFPLELRPVPRDEQDEPEPLPLYPIAFDGITLAKPEETSRIFMASGNRVDVLVQAPQEGVYELWKPQLNLGLLPEPPQVRFMATVIVQGQPISMPSPAALSSLPAPFEDITAPELDPKQTLPHRVLTWGEDLTPPGPDPTQGFPRFLIGGRYTYDRSRNQVVPLDDGEPLQFDSERVDQIMRLGAVEEWQIVNPALADHPFHIHQFSFQVTEINGKKLALPTWYDTISVPGSTSFDQAGQPIPGSVTFRARIEGVKGNEDDIRGKFVLHCHLLDHEDLGMMQVVEVEP
jgi:FtsP/CotA-like multicopper oxidase with cupredoxin domain